jgi:flavodoxin
MSKNLIVYYSHSGNTRKAAMLLKNQLKADVIELIPKKAYAPGLWDAVDEFKEEIANDLRREIKSYNLNVADYDNIFIGTPNWGDTVATPLRSFFDKEDLRHKNIMPFVTHGGGGLGNCSRDIIELSQSDKHGNALVFTNGGIDKRMIEKWLNEEEIN